MDHFMLCTHFAFSIILHNHCQEFQLQQASSSCRGVLQLILLQVHDLAATSQTSLILRKFPCHSFHAGADRIPLLGTLLST
jgi:hypothetical protein